MNKKIEIKELALKHEAFALHDAPGLFFLKMFLITFSLLGIIALSLPFRTDLSTQLHSMFFVTEVLLWFGFTITAGFALYKSSFPADEPKWIQKVLFSLLGVLLLMALAHPLPQDLQFSHLFHNEFDLWKGRCGFIIAIISVLNSVFLFHWARQGAPAKPVNTGLYAGFVAAGMGCMLMQLVCNHSEPFHLVLWHFTPLLLISWVGQKLGRKILSW